MHKASREIYSELSFTEHSIPDVSTTTSSGGKVYYHHQEHIYSYDISSRSHIRLHQMKSCSELFVVKNVLCAVHANFLKVFEKEPRELKLRDIPRRVVLSNDRAQNKDGVGFLYEDSIEIFTPTRYPIKTIDVPPSLEMVDFTNVEDTTYILSRQGRVFKTKNIFLTHQLVSATPLVIIPEATNTYNGIFSYNGSILLSSSDKKSSRIEKYEIGASSLTLEYSFNFQSHCNAAVRHGFLLAGNTVHLSNAPILVVEDRLYNVFRFNSNSLMGISAGRIYFMEDLPRTPNNQLSYELSSHSFTINPNSIEVPDFIKDQQQADHFLRNETLLIKYEMVLKKIQEIDQDLAKREHELRAQRVELESAMEKVEAKKKSVEERIQELASRARKIRARGDFSGFYQKVKALEDRMEQADTKDFSGLKEKLKAQRAVLREQTH